MPNGKNGSAIYKNTDYKLTFNNIVNDYEGASWINENSKAKKWISQYLSSYGTSTNDNMKIVSYLLDTNVWSEYYAGDKAEYAIGGPTLEMFCASYKATHPSKYLDCGGLNSNGYNVKWSNESSYQTWRDGIPQDEYSSIYIKSDTSKANAMWFGSPSSVANDNLMYAGYNNCVYYGSYTKVHAGIRPVVCLKSETLIQMQQDGTFTIVESADNRTKLMKV